MNLDREALGRLMRAAWFDSLGYNKDDPYIEWEPTVARHKEAYMAAAEAVAAYVLAQTPEPVALEELAHEARKAFFSGQEDDWKDCGDENRSDWFNVVRAVLARYAAQAPIAPQPRKMRQGRHGSRRRTRSFPL